MAAKNPKRNIGGLTSLNRTRGDCVFFFPAPEGSDETFISSVRQSADEMCGKWMNLAVK